MLLWKKDNLGGQLLKMKQLKFSQTKRGFFFGLQDVDGGVCPILMKISK